MAVVVVAEIRTETLVVTLSSRKPEEIPKSLEHLLVSWCSTGRSRCTSALRRSSLAAPIPFQEESNRLPEEEEHCCKQLKGEPVEHMPRHCCPKWAWRDQDLHKRQPILEN